MTIRSYSELSQLTTFEERYEYLRLEGSVGRETFGFDRYLNQMFYASAEWKYARNSAIVRDNGCDLGILGYEIHTHILVHHMNPIGPSDIVDGEAWILDPEYLITTTHFTHNLLHFGVKDLSPPVVIERKPNDTTLW